MSNPSKILSRYCEKILFSFRETSSFTKKLLKLFTDDEYSKFQRLLIQFPEGGNIIKNSGGIRKIRFPAKGKGKRGGARVIYYFAVGREEIFLLDIYTKGDKTDLTLPELNKLRKIVKGWLEK